MSSSSWPPWIALTIAVIVMLSRHPALLTEPALWAEEGTIYFENAWLLPPASALVAPYGGYYALVPNVATLLAARCFPIDYAPWITMSCALLAAQLPVAHILWSPARFFSAPTMRYGSALAVVVLSGFLLTTMYSMVYLTALTFLIILEETEPTIPRRRRVLNRALLVVAGLGSPMSGFLLPALLLLARRLEHMRFDAAILLGCVILQGIACVESFPGQARTAYLDLLLLPPAVVLQLIDTIVPTGLLQGLRQGVYTLARESVLWKWTLAILAMGLFVLALGRLTRVLPASHRSLFAWSLAALIVIPFGLGVNEIGLLVLGEPNPRYTFGATVVLLLWLGHAATRGRDPAFVTQKRVCAVLFLMALVTSFGRGLRTSYRGPLVSWRAEVAEWRRDPEHMIRVLPPGWAMLLREEVPDVVVTAQSRLGQPSGTTPGLPSLSMNESYDTRDTPDTKVKPGENDRPEVAGPVGVIRTAHAFSRGTVVLAPPLEEDRFLDLGSGRRGRLFVDLLQGAWLRIEFQTDQNGHWRIEFPPKDLCQHAGIDLCIQALITEPVTELTNAVRFRIALR